MHLHTALAACWRCRADLAAISAALARDLEIAPVRRCFSRSEVNALARINFESAPILKLN